MLIQFFCVLKVVFSSGRLDLGAPEIKDGIWRLRLLFWPHVPFLFLQPHQGSPQPQRQAQSQSQCLPQSKFRPQIQPEVKLQIWSLLQQQVNPHLQFKLQTKLKNHSAELQSQLHPHPPPALCPSDIPPICIPLVYSWHHLPLRQWPFHRLVQWAAAEHGRILLAPSAGMWLSCLHISGRSWDLWPHRPRHVPFSTPTPPTHAEEVSEIGTQRKSRPVYSWRPVLWTLWHTKRKTTNNKQATMIFIITSS